MVGDVVCFHKVDKRHNAWEVMALSHVQNRLEGKQTILASQLGCASKLELGAMLVQDLECSFVHDATKDFGHDMTSKFQLFSRKKMNALYLIEIMRIDWLQMLDEY